MSIPFNQGGPGVVDSIVSIPLLLPGSRPIIQTMPIAGGQNLPIGAVLGLANSGANAGMLVYSVATATDGSQTPVALAAFPISTFLADGSTPQPMQGAVYVQGGFNLNAVYYDSSWSVTAIRIALLDAGFPTGAPSWSGG